MLAITWELTLKAISPNNVIDHSILDDHTRRAVMHAFLKGVAEDTGSGSQPSIMATCIREYIATGDYVLISCLMDPSLWKVLPKHEDFPHNNGRTSRGYFCLYIRILFDSLIKHGNIMQTKVAIQCLPRAEFVLDLQQFRSQYCIETDPYTTFLESDDPDTSLDVIKLMNMAKIEHKQNTRI
ncbi:hypothetical protein SAMD00019534_116560 [Acytostelium subglobosum LB1]|uniref:hypothetical protein n=1 Tax=Acytostelium subglobosum LB1 TaxID=1410327 RepID=UPI000644E126|nr:hypothetical protein SAMD00019534_116560 [Acytostelium subglobosum LB1]GAM28480.1 hypothetical protein SAMD00019534_116560 [Acytostelium subglobosum LB1]|eukprot:XP_012748519.1 hypothetical protein SAMD00019534_116560 [Acytostelium subglobosum LB1]